MNLIMSLAQLTPLFYMVG